MFYYNDTLVHKEIINDFIAKHRQDNLSQLELVSRLFLTLHNI
jgi:hypothetical protein